MKVIASVLVVIFIMAIQDVEGQEGRMEPAQCPKVIQNCMSKDYAEVVQADKNCNDCCRRAGCDRGDCRDKKCKCKSC